VRAIGASNYSAERLAEALRVSQEHGLPRYQTMQPFYNLYDRARFEESIESLCLKEHLGVITYFSLARGFLSGKYRSESDLSKSQRGGGVKDYLNSRGFRILAALDQVAKIRNATQAQVALAWLMARPSITAPIASATSLEQLQDLIAATQLELDEASIEFLNDASDWKKERAA
jgi:aryl-alcohol dehydrogenase-like predicted oxidoreductase